MTHNDNERKYKIQMKHPAASSGILSSLLNRYSAPDTESSPVYWIPAFAGMTNSRQAAGNTTQRDIKLLEGFFVVW